MKQKRGTPASPMSRRLESLLEWPSGLLGRCTRMEWVDNREVRMDGCCEIMEYEENTVLVAVAGGQVRFWGQGLQLHGLTTDTLLLTGRLQSVEFLE